MLFHLRGIFPWYVSCKTTRCRSNMTIPATKHRFHLQHRSNFVCLRGQQVPGEPNRGGKEGAGSAHPLAAPIVHPFLEFLHELIKAPPVIDTFLTSHFDLNNIDCSSTNSTRILLVVARVWVGNPSLQPPESYL